MFSSIPFQVFSETQRARGLSQCPQTALQRPYVQVRPLGVLFQEPIHPLALEPGRLNSDKPVAQVLAELSAKLHLKQEFHIRCDDSLNGVTLYNKLCGLSQNSNLSLKITSGISEIHHRCTEHLN